MLGFVLLPMLSVWSFNRLTSFGSLELGEFDFTFTVHSKGPLGVKLDYNMKILGFARPKDGSKLQVEASGLVKPFDRLIAVNDQLLLGLNLTTATGTLAAAEFPKAILFRPQTPIARRRINTEFLKVADQKRYSMDVGGAMKAYSEALAHLHDHATAQITLPFSSILLSQAHMLHSHRRYAEAAKFYRQAITVRKSASSEPVAQQRQQQQLQQVFSKQWQLQVQLAQAEWQAGTTCYVIHWRVM
jgi:hypothetical protein